MRCHHFTEQKCLSCPWLNQPYSEQLTRKQQQFVEQLVPFKPEAIDPPIKSQLAHFRNKAKMAVLGTVEKPILGITNHRHEAIDLCHCPLYPKPLQEALTRLKSAIKTLGLVPYNINKKRGELKFIILTYQNNQFMLRFVLRSTHLLSQLSEQVSWFKTLIPNLTVISANIQPTHAAILEGEQEVILTQARALPVTLNQVPLFIRPQSFFQTNSRVAEQLYAAAANWLHALPKPQSNIQAYRSIWDLFCGVGGFGLHCADNYTHLTGIEINPQAIASAKQSAALMGLPDPDFRALDSTMFAIDQQLTPDVVIVNPPRRGLGQSLTDYLQQLGPNTILYSSCNLTTQLNDIARLSHYRVMKAQLFDMFPHTAHTETLLLLQKRG